MEESPPKRRRITPPSGGDEDDGASPPATSPSRLSRNRPSFASPTKASMSRHNPEILERRRSASPPKSPSPARISPKRRQPTGLVYTDPVGSSRLQRPAETIGASETGEQEETNTRDEEAGGATEAPSQPARAGLRAAPRRSLNKPSPRPLPPPAPEGEDELNPFLGRRRRSPRTGITIPPPPEPELPPSVPDAVSSTPPRGIHSSSPSRWRSGGKPKKTSPLKQKPLRISDEPRRNSSLMRFFQKRGAAADQQPGDDATASEQSMREVRGVPVQDANTKKRKERDGLVEELTRLERDLGATTRENDRIRSMRAARRNIPFLDEENLLDIIKRQLVPDDPDLRPAQSQLLARAALNPTLLMSYKKPPAQVATAAYDDIDYTGIKSHYPVPMSSAEELPFLQLFSPFDITSSLTILPGEPNTPIRQLFALELSTRHSMGMFNARIEAIVDAVKHSIISLDVPALDPAAKAELGPFLKTVCSGDQNRSVQCNIGIVSWAMAEWVRVAELRARFWSRLHLDTAAKEVLAETNRNIRKRKPRRGKGRRSKDAEDEEEHGNAHDVKRDTVARYMGQQYMDMSLPLPDEASATSSLRLEWKINFDWTGEAQSKLSAMIGAPGKWHRVDEKGALGKVPSLFESLVEGGEEPVLAARKMIALLAGEE